MTKPTRSSSVSLAFLVPHFKAKLIVTEGHARCEYESSQSMARWRKYSYYKSAYDMIYLCYVKPKEFQNTTITSYPDLEPDAIGTYDDTVLNLLDGIMVKAHSFGIKVYL